MEIVSESKNGIAYLLAVLKDKVSIVTKAVLWKIPHNTGIDDVRLKIGRYKKVKLFDTNFHVEELENQSPKSELTLESEEFANLIQFLAENYELFRKGIKSYISIDKNTSEQVIGTIKAILESDDRKKIVEFLSSYEMDEGSLTSMMQSHSRLMAIKEFEGMLQNDEVEAKWQRWFELNSWILGSEIVDVLEERDIDVENIADILYKAYDGFVDVIEIKRPEGTLKFWSEGRDHGNLVPSMHLVKAITQSLKYIYEIELESNSAKFIDRCGGSRVVKPRCILVFGRSNEWTDDEKKAYRILNSGYHNLTIMTYDHVLERAKRIMGISNQVEKPEEDLPF